MTIAADTQISARSTPLADLAGAACAGQVAAGRLSANANAGGPVPAAESAGLGHALPLASSAGKDRKVLSPLDAAEHAGQAAAGPGDVLLEDVRSRAFERNNAGRQAKRRFRSNVAGRVTRDETGRERLPSDVVVDRGPYAGLTVGELMQRQRPAPVPDEVKHGTDAQRRREFLNRTVGDGYKRFCQEERLDPTPPKSVERFNRERGPWLEELFRREGVRVGTKRSSLIKKDELIAAGQPTDGRYRSGRRRGELFPPEIFEQCAALYTTSPMDLTGPHSVFAWGRAEAATQGREWKGSEQRFRELIAEHVTKPERVLGREGDWAHEARCLPKMKRPPSGLPCGKGGSLDGTPDDVFSQGTGRDGRPRPIRLYVVGLAYHDSGKVVLETGRSEGPGPTMRPLRRVYADDILEELDTDWGPDFTRMVGKRRGVLASPLMEQVQRLTERYGTRVDQKPVRKAWLKRVEPFWARKEAHRPPGRVLHRRDQGREEDCTGARTGERRPAAESQGAGRRNPAIG